MNPPVSAISVFWLLVFTAVSPAAAQELHESLRELDRWLGTWQVPQDAQATTHAEFRVVLGGRFVEAWQRDADTGAMMSHSMIAAGERDGALTEYRFDAEGRLSVRPFEAGAGPRGTRVAQSWTVPGFVDLDRSVVMLEPFLGQWEVVTDWLDGGVMWAQMTNRSELGGRLICSNVLAAQNGEPPYDRFRTFYFHDEAGDLRETTFTYSGKIVHVKLLVHPVEQGVSLLTVYEPGTMAPIGIRKRLTIDSDRRMRWSDDFRDEGDGEWERVIDAEWVRTATADRTRRAMPVDDTLFAAAATEARAVRVERVVDAAPDAVWAAWTTEPGWKSAYAPGRPETRANIHLAPGGTYEWLFDGELGCNGCQVLSYLPPRMLSFTWNSPVTQPRTRLRRTWVVVELEPVDGGGTLVRLTQLGFGDGPHWDETYEYFGKAWAYVLEQMALNLAGLAVLSR